MGIRFVSARGLSCAALSLTLFLAACGGGGDANVNLPAPDLDEQLKQALAEAGIGIVPQPPAGDPALVELGRALFFDRILSGNQNISCSTCHTPLGGTGDFLPVSIGEGGVGTSATRQLLNGELIPRNAPHVFNAGVEGVDTMFWDSRIHRDPITGELTTPEPMLNGPNPQLPAIVAQLDSALTAQAMFPVTSHDEMRGKPGSNPIADATSNEEVWTLLVERLVGTNDGQTGGIQGYEDMFRTAYPNLQTLDDVNFGHVAKALAAFERDAWTGLDTPFDRYLAGDDSALSAAAKRGAIVFCEDGKCAECHSGPLLSDFQHHALAMPQIGPGKNAPGDDIGRAIETDPSDEYKFRTPQLRNVALTGPWSHSGAYTTLEGVVRHHLNPINALVTYDASQLRPLFAATHDVSMNGARAAALDPILAAPIDLTDQQMSDLMEFLHALTDPRMVVLTRDFPDSVPSGHPVGD